MIYRILADGILIFHFCFLLFVVFGGFLVLRWRWVRWLHIPCALWGIAIEYFGWICPLTPLEIEFRGRAGELGYVGGFIEHYITAAMYPAGLTRLIQTVLGTLVLAINVGVYVMFYRRRREDREMER